MIFNMKRIGIIATIALIFGVFGCASNTQQITQLEKDVQTRDKAIAALKSDLNKQKAEAERLKKEAEQKAKEAEAAKAAIAQKAEKPKIVTTAVDSSKYLLPPGAKPGECYARVFIPPKYKTVTEKVLVKEASEKIETIPPKYEWVEKKILIKEPSYILKKVPAKYEWREEKVLVKPATTVWKKGRGPIEKLDNGTGEIMCLVKVPAQYKTIRKRVLVRPPSTQKIEIPAQYKTIRIKKLVEPAKTVKIKIPAEYKTITKKVKVSDGKLVWRRVLCETNMTPATIARIQRALKRAGFDPGPIDGVYGKQTQAAVRKYQIAKGLARGGLTTETLRSLGIY